MRHGCTFSSSGAALDFLNREVASLGEPFIELFHQIGHCVLLIVVIIFGLHAKRPRLQKYVSQSDCDHRGEVPLCAFIRTYVCLFVVCALSLLNHAKQCGVQSVGVMGWGQWL